MCGYRAIGTRIVPSSQVVSPGFVPRHVPGTFGCAVRAALNCLIHSLHHARTVGRFVLSPITRQTDSGQFAASLSIRSGHGSASHDRVFRFTPLFTSAQAAARYALEQGLSYLRQPALPA